jgi:hypothetical protein
LQLDTKRSATRLGARGGRLGSEGKMQLVTAVQLILAGNDIVNFYVPHVLFGSAYVRDKISFNKNVPVSAVGHAWQRKESEH